MSPRTTRTDSGGSLLVGGVVDETSSNSTLQPIKTLTQIQRRLRFANRTRIYLIPSLDEYRDEDLAAMWQTEEDQNCSQQDVLTNIIKMREMSPQNDHEHHDDEYCGRGLEHMRSSAHMEERRAHKEAVLHGVLDIQDGHFDAGIFDEDEIAQVASEASQSATQRALSLAASDAAYVRRHVRADLEQQLATATKQNQEQTETTDTVAPNKSVPHSRGSTTRNTLSPSPVDSFLNQISTRVSIPEMLHQEKQNGTKDANQG